MIDIDDPQFAFILAISIVYICPFIYSFFVDHYDKETPPEK